MGFLYVLFCFFLSWVVNDYHSSGINFKVFAGLMLVGIYLQTYKRH